MNGSLKKKEYFAGIFLYAATVQRVDIYRYRLTHGYYLKLFIY